MRELEVEDIILGRRVTLLIESCGSTEMLAEGFSILVIKEKEQIQIRNPTTDCSSRTSNQIPAMVFRILVSNCLMGLASLSYHI